jgi:hypothetical protein
VVFLAATGRRPTLEKLVLAEWGGALAVLGFELAARVVTRPFVYRPRLEVTFHPDPQILGGTRAPSRFSTNTRGMRGPEWDEAAYKVLCVGGSTTACIYLDDADAWPGRLMALLNERSRGRRYWVGNVGKSGHDSFQHLELLRRLPEARAVDALVILTGVNDFNRSLRLTPATRRRLARIDIFDSGGPPSPLLPYLKQTVLYRSAAHLRPARRGIDVEDARGAVYARRRAERQRTPRDHPLGPLGEPLRGYADQLGEIAGWCADHRVRCIFLTQPTLWQDPMPPELEAITYSTPIGTSGRTLSAADAARGMAAFNDALLELCRERSLECVDLARALPKDASIHYDQEHFTIRGAEAVAAIAAERLLTAP